MKLRKGVTFHNGEPFNAEAVRYSMEILKDPKTLNYGYFKVFKESPGRGRLHRQASFRMRPTRPPSTIIANMFSIYPPQYYKKVGCEGFGKSPNQNRPLSVRFLETGY